MKRVSRKRKAKMNPYLKIFLKVFSITAISGLFLFLLVMCGAVLGFFGEMDSLDLEVITGNSSSQIVYIDSQGNEQVIATLSAEQNRIWVGLADIPQDMKDAIIAIEDERFYSHQGFDVKRTTKAFFSYVGNKLAGKASSFGGSTITQQLVKNITGDDEVTPARKIQEISRAVNLEKKISKDEILELYLNSIYLSQGCHGIQAASQKFFGKPVSELNLAECASIAGITQYPSRYDPLRNPKNNKEKQEIVLAKMLQLGYISQEEHDAAVAYELTFTEIDPATLASGTTINSYFIDQVECDVLADLKAIGYSDIVAKKILYSGGLKIIATIEPSVQNAMENVFENIANFPNYNPDDPIQAAMVVLDPYTGAVKGIVGGIGAKTGNLVLNRATQTTRQPGSSIKPIAVYGPAIENGIITPADVYEDKPVSYPNGNGGLWSPHNSGNEFIGKVSVRKALQKSLNTVAVQILAKVGVNTSYNILERDFGITTLTDSDMGLPSLALGGLTNGASVLEMTAAYTPFVNRGVYSKPYTYESVTDSTGNVILSNRPTQNIAMSEEAAYVMSRMLKEVVASGTGGSAQLGSGMYTAGKTGTSDEYKDRWFVGYTPYYVGAVWHGYDSPKSVSSVYNSPVIWNKVMTEIHKNKAVKTDIPAPSAVRYLSYCSETGLLPGEHCGDAVTGFWFVPGHTPTETCESRHLPEGEEETINIDNTEVSDSSESGGAPDEYTDVVEEPAA